MDKEIQENWERFLDPAELRPNLILASIYIASFEILKNCILERIREFYTFTYEDERWIPDPSYDLEVLSKHKNPTYASLKWLEEQGAIDITDIKKFEKVKSLRNILAHELTKLLARGLPLDFSERFIDLVAILNKVEKWWFINVELPLNQNLIGKEKELDYDGIIPGSIANLHMMVDIALGSDEIATYYIREFRKNFKK